MEAGETSVGAHVCVSHEKPTFLDEEYTISCVLTQIGTAGDSPTR